MFSACIPRWGGPPPSSQPRLRVRSLWVIAVWKHTVRPGPRATNMKPGTSIRPFRHGLRQWLQSLPQVPREGKVGEGRTRVSVCNSAVWLEFVSECQPVKNNLYTAVPLPLVWRRCVTETLHSLVSRYLCISGLWWSRGSYRATPVITPQRRNVSMPYLRELF